MMERQIISKGEYRHYQIDNFISVKQYIFLRVDGKKCLTLRYTNSLGCKVNAFKFLLVQIDIKGNVISKKKVRVSDIVFANNTDYTPSKGIVVDEKCVDFKVLMLCAYAGRYRYKLKNDKIALYYVPHKYWDYEENGGNKKRFKVVSKTNVRAPSVRLLAFAVLIALVILVFSPIITFFAKRIFTNLKDNIKETLEERAAIRAEQRAAKKAEKEKSKALEDVTYED